MGVSFNGSTQFLRRSTQFTAPFSVSLWFYPTDQVNQQTIFIVQSAIATSEAHAIFLIGATGLLVAQDTTGGTLAAGASVSGVNFDAWNHLCCVFDSTAGINLNLNGGSVDNGIYQAASTNRCRIAAQQNTSIPVTHGSFFTGNIAEVGVWNVDIDAIWPDMRAALAHGWSPLCFNKPGAMDLIHYAQFLGRLKDATGGTGWTADGAPPYVANPPKMIYPA